MPRWIEAQSAGTQKVQCDGARTRPEHRTPDEEPRGEHLTLLSEAVQCQADGGFEPESLDGDFFAVLIVIAYGSEHLTHAAFANSSEDAVGPEVLAFPAVAGFDYGVGQLLNDVRDGVTPAVSRSMRANTRRRASSERH